MKVLSLTQPFATLVIIGAKKIETRGWAPKKKEILAQLDREGLLIHASETIKREYQDMICKKPFFDILKAAGIKIFGQPGQRKMVSDTMPRGAILGKVNFNWTIKTEFCIPGNVFEYDGRRFEITDQELAFGDYSPGRKGWLLSEPIRFAEPISGIKGSLSLWDCPEDILEQIIKAAAIGNGE